MSAISIAEEREDPVRSARQRFLVSRRAETHVVVGLVRTLSGQTEVVGLDVRQLGELDVCK